jgi:TonB family protein
MTEGRRPRRAWEALAIAAAVNAGVVLVLDRIIVPAARLSFVAARPEESLPIGPPLTSAGLGVGVVTTMPPALPLEAILGVGDDAEGTGRAARPSAAELPGARAADRGGGDVGGVDTWTDRRDRADDAALRSRIWSGGAAYLTPRTPGDRRAASPEAIHRAPTAAYGDRAPQPVARAGEDTARLGDASGAGNAGGPTAVGIDDARAGRAGATAPEARGGAVATAREAAYVDRGAPAVDVARRGATADDRAVAAASDQRRPDPFDLTPPRSGGGAGEGVRGAPGAGLVSDGWGQGTAASRTQAPAGDDGAPTYASRRDPYFYELFRRLDERIVYPRELAIGLVSGRVIASLVLRPDGTLAEIAVFSSSGYRAFDDEVTAALRGLGRLGPVPAALLSGRDTLRVRLMYTFKSPVIL